METDVRHDNMPAIGFGEYLDSLDRVKRDLDAAHRPEHEARVAAIAARQAEVEEAKETLRVFLEYADRVMKKHPDIWASAVFVNREHIAAIRTLCEEETR